MALIATITGKNVRSQSLHKSGLFQENFQSISDEAEAQESLNPFINQVFSKKS